jgi:hypothetical protein
MIITGDICVSDALCIKRNGSFTIFEYKGIFFQMIIGLNRRYFIR